MNIFYLSVCISFVAMGASHNSKQLQALLDNKQKLKKALTEKTLPTDPMSLTTIGKHIAKYRRRSLSRSLSDLFKKSKEDETPTIVELSESDILFQLIQFHRVALSQHLENEINKTDVLDTSNHRLLTQKMTIESVQLTHALQTLDSMPEGYLRHYASKAS